MLAFLQDTAKATKRKLMLLHCACSRRVWHVFPDERSRQAVDVVERYSDGLTDLHTLRAAASAAEGAWFRDGSGFGAPAATTAWWELEQVSSQLTDASEPLEMTVSVVQQLAFGGFWAFKAGNRRRDPKAAQQEELAAQAAILRDVFGPLPFREVVLDPAWLTGTVRSLAEAAYQERQLPDGTLDPARLSVLADALEDAGAGGELVAHLRGPGQHWRGCWAVDVLTGRQ
jgi:hypothetical protein